MQIWTQASQMAAQTPQDRNRYVDFLRSVSILVVITGHWMIATAYVVDGEMNAGHLLAGRPQLHWLTWLFQVMPIFFIVGGYSNAVSLESAKRKGIGYAGWLSARLNRLVVATACPVGRVGCYRCRDVAAGYEGRGHPVRFAGGTHTDLVPGDLHRRRHTGALCIQALATVRIYVVLDVRSGCRAHRRRVLRGRHTLAWLDQLLLGLARCPPPRFCLARRPTGSRCKTTALFCSRLRRTLVADLHGALSARHGWLSRPRVEQYSAAKNNAAGAWGYFSSAYSSRLSHRCGVH